MHAQNRRCCHCWDGMDNILLWASIFCENTKKRHLKTKKSKMCSDSCISLVFLWTNQPVWLVFMSAHALLSEHNANATNFAHEHFWTFLNTLPTRCLLKASKSLQIIENSWNERCSRVPSTPNPKTMRQTKYLDPKASEEKNYFFYRNHFFAIFFTFFDISKSQISRSGRFGDVHQATLE